MEIKIETPLTNNKINDLKAGDLVLLSGTIYSARDAAHKRMIDCLDNNKELPMEVDGAVIYYVGPSPKKPGQVIGAAGPTTSYRMDDYTPRLLDLGLKGMIGKGKRDEKVIESMIKNNSIYFGAIGGAAALISKSIIKSEIIAYDDLGAEAVRRMEVKDLPLIVIVDSKGSDLYEIGRKEYLRSSF